MSDSKFLGDASLVEATLPHGVDQDTPARVIDAAVPGKFVSQVNLQMAAVVRDSLASDSNLPGDLVVVLAVLIGLLDDWLNFGESEFESGCHGELLAVAGDAPGGDVGGQRLAAAVVFVATGDDLAFDIGIDCVEERLGDSLAVGFSQAANDAGSDVGSGHEVGWMRWWLPGRLSDPHGSLQKVLALTGVVGPNEWSKSDLIGDGLHASDFGGEGGGERFTLFWRECIQGSLEEDGSLGGLLDDVVDVHWWEVITLTMLPR